MTGAEQYGSALDRQAGLDRLYPTDGEWQMSRPVEAETMTREELAKTKKKISEADSLAKEIDALTIATQRICDAKWLDISFESDRSRCLHSTGVTIELCAPRFIANVKEKIREAFHAVIAERISECIARLDACEVP